MKRIIGVILMVMFIPLSAASSQDNSYGDYLIFDSGQPVSMDLEKAKLVDVLKMFSQQTGLNFVSTEAVKDRELTLYLDKVPIEEAMDTIFQANNLAYDYFPDSNIFIVKEMGKPSIELQTKVYHLRYACVADSRIAKGFSATVETDEDSGGLQEAEGIATTIKEVVARVISENGSVSEEPRMNALIVTDVPSQFPTIDRVIEELDQPVFKVLIEVEVLDVSKDDWDEFGMLVKYEGHTSKKKDFRFLQNTTTPLQNVFGDVIKAINSGNMGTLSLNEFSIMMSFLKQRSTTRLLANPKLMVLSHQEAIIHVGNEIWSQETEYREVGGGSESVMIGDKKTQTGVQLQIIPQVNSLAKDVTLIISVEISDSFTLTSGQYFYTKPTRSINTVARLAENKTLLVGGLIRKDDTLGREKIPFLGEIPILGAFFRSKSDRRQDRELLVFITPRIVEEEAYFAGNLKGSYAQDSNYSRRRTIKLALDKFTR